MLVHEGDRRTIGIDLRLAILLAFFAGALNAAGFQAAGMFSANMTGNVSALSDQIALGHIGSAGIFVVLIGAFILGASSAGILIEFGRSRGDRAVYAHAVLFEAALLLTLCGLTLTMPDRRAVLVVGLSFILGVQNATTTRISDARVRTTHVSGMATDIGLGLAAIASGREAPRFVLSSFTLVAFLLGGIAGVVVYMLIGGWLLLVVATVLAAMAVCEARRARTIADT